ncbi:MAG: biopolymer transporter ExbD [Kiritimatiellae bacterium]|nr:biopolymer transporter ExbD [Kiritimatiellia bacterium]
MKIHIPDDGSGGFQMAPLIDIVFLLIIFFMVAADMNQQARIPLEIPSASHATRPKDPSGRGVISIKENGDFFAGQTKVTADQLRELAEQRVKENPNFRIFLRAAKGTPHKFVREAMQATAEGGIADIIFSAYATEQ